VDFSGAADACRKIWIAQGIESDDALLIEKCVRADDLLGTGKGIRTCLEALRDFIAGEKNCAFGLDFPFGLPMDLIHEDRWEDFIMNFPLHFRHMNDFRDKCRSAFPGQELRRLTDIESRAPFSPYNLRIYRQTYYGISYLLRPIVRDKLACVLPMQQILPGKPWVLEICPASTLKKLLNLKRIYPYKGHTSAHHSARLRILDALKRTGKVTIPGSVYLKASEDCGGDALDSIVAVYSTYMACRNLSAFKGRLNCSIEGYIFS
jgi:hypothetical protein